MLIRLRRRWTCLHAAAALVMVVAPLGAQAPGDTACDDPGHHATHDVRADPHGKAASSSGSPHDPAMGHGVTVEADVAPTHPSPGPGAADSEDCEHCPTSDCGTDPGCDVPTAPAEVISPEDVRRHRHRTSRSPEVAAPAPSPPPKSWSPPPRVTL